MPQKTEIQKEVERLNKEFLHSSDFIAKEISWGPNEQAILCFYTSLVNKSDVEQYLYRLRLTQTMQSQSQSNKAQPNESSQKDEQAQQSPKDEQAQQSPKDGQAQQSPKDGQAQQNPKDEQAKSKQIVEQVIRTKKIVKDILNSKDEQARPKEKVEQVLPYQKVEQDILDKKNGQTKPNQNDIQSKQNQKIEQPSPNQKSNPPKQNEDSSQTQPKQSDSLTITTETYDNQKLVEYVCNGETLIILLKTNEMIRVNSPEFVHRTTEEPGNEQVLRGSHEGLIENFDSNVSLIRRRIKNNDLVVKELFIGKETKTLVYYFYVNGLVDEEALKTVEERLQNIDTDIFYSVGQLSDYLDDQVWSPFPQLLNTERPDRVVSNILEGKIAIITDISPTALIGPITFFTFYQSPDDFNSRVLVGSFYRIVRIVCFLAAIFLPAFYIAIVSFHFEVLPLELANKVKADINQIPYRPLIEALIMEITIEIIREASVRLPKSIGQTIGIVGGLVIGDAIVSAGLVSNLMVIVVAFTAISSFVVPSVEMNITIRMLRFPFMLMSSLFGFFGIVIGTFLLVIHLLNLSSLKQPYFSPIIPFQPKEIYKIFLRAPYYKANKQVSSFSPPKDEES